MSPITTFVLNILTLQKSAFYFIFYLFIYLIILICLFTFCFLIVRSDLVLSLFFYRLCTGIWPPETF